MSRALAIAAVAGILLGVLVGFLWWGRPLGRLQTDLADLQGQRAAAEVARERLKAVEVELSAERDRRMRLENAVSQGRK